MASALALDKTTCGQCTYLINVLSVIVLYLTTRPAALPSLYKYATPYQYIRSLHTLTCGDSATPQNIAQPILPFTLNPSKHPKPFTRHNQRASYLLPPPSRSTFRVPYPDLSVPMSTMPSRNIPAPIRLFHHLGQAITLQSAARLRRCHTSAHVKSLIQELVRLRCQSAASNRPIAKKMDIVWRANSPKAGGLPG